MAAPQQPRFFTKVRDLGLKSDPNMHRAYRGPFRVRIEARQKWWRRQIFRQLVYQRINDRRCSPRSSSPVSWEGTFALLSRLEKPCGSKEVDLPLFRFPLRGQTGAGGFPPRRKHAARQQKALARSDAASSPHKRAAAPLCIPRSHSGPFRTRPGEDSVTKRIKDGRHVGLDFYDLLIEPIMKSILSGVLTPALFLFPKICLREHSR